MKKLTAMVAIAASLLTFATKASAEDDIPINGPAQVSVPEPEELPITGSAVASQPSERIVTWNRTVMVNSLPYSHGDIDTAITAFELVTAERGWSPAETRAWIPFMQGVIGRESGGCWNVYFGQRAGEGCSVSGRPRGSAAGFGQVIYASNTFLCAKDGICSKHAITASPWNSMTSVVSLVERSGKGPWCYTASLRAGRLCRIAPAR